MSVPQTMHPARLGLIRLTALALVLSQSLPAWADPSQEPLINRPEGRPLYNLMLTLDDSGSMTHQYLPEGTFTLNNQSVYFPPDARIYVHPLEIPKNIWAANRNFVTPISAGEAPNQTTYNTFYDTRFITAVPRDKEAAELDAQSKLFQYQMRSPQLNTIYYNPAIKYTPWRNVTSSGTHSDFTAATFASAKLDPLALDPNGANTYPSGWIEGSTANLTEIKPYTLYWSQRYEPWNPTLAPQGSAQTKTYNPALLYLLNDNANPNSVDSYQYFDLNTSAGSITYPHAYTKRTDCSTSGNTTTCPTAAERSNFANWFVYYRSRLLIAQGGLPDTLNGMNNKFRGGWGTLHQGIKYNAGIPYDYLTAGALYSVDSDSSKTVQHGVRDWTAPNQYEFTKWIRTLKTYGGTPTRQAVQSVQDYFKRTDNFSPWSSDMVNGSSLVNHLSCRRSYNLVLTDGYYTSLTNADTPLGKNADVNGSKALDGLVHPFSDGASNTLADYVMDSWLTDLQPGLADNVKPVVVTPKSTSDNDVLLAKIQSDPATHQHLNYFFLGFGITGNLLNKSVLDKTNSTARDDAIIRLAKCNVAANGSCWNDINPDQATPNDRVDDMWHAVLNSRGDYFSVNDLDDLRSGLTNAITKAGNDSFKEGGVATASATMTDDNVKYVPQYAPYDWTGTVHAQVLNAKGEVQSEKWDAEKVLPAPAARTIYTWNAGRAVSLDSAGISELDQATKDILTPALVDFLRGGPGDPETMRHRAPGKLLPDFINSTPLFVKGDGQDGLLFIGGNGGMLHAFSTTTGIEKFAFVPSAVIPKLPLVAQANYGTASNFHEYFVDGQLNDTVVTSANARNHIVVGTLGAGGKSVFALQLTESDVTSNLDARTVKWEVTHDDMGFITSIPQFGRLPDGTWKVFLGNGVDSKSGKVALLMIDVESGFVQSIQLPTPPDSGPRSGTSAGLGGVTLVHDSKDGNVAAIYAGDTLGRVWRFDVASDSTIAVGYGKEPLFTTSDADTNGKAQPITAGPAVFNHTLGGQVVVVSTGRLLYDTDASDTQLQSTYGLWDKVLPTKSSVSLSSPGITRADLQHQAIVSRDEIDQTKGGSRTFFELTSSAVSWTDTASNPKAKLGWLLDLAIPTAPGSDTAFVYPKAIYEPIPFDRSVLITALLPGKKQESCTAAKAIGYGFLVKAQTGAQPDYAPLDANGDGLINSRDLHRSGFEYDGGGRQVLIKDSKRVRTSSTDPGVTPETCVGNVCERCKGDVCVRCVGNECKKCVGDECNTCIGSKCCIGDECKQCLGDECKDCRKGDLLTSTKDILGNDCGSNRIADRVWRQLLNPPKP